MVAVINHPPCCSESGIIFTWISVDSILSGFCEDCLQFVAHPVDLLDVGEHHLRIKSSLLHHAGHVLRCQEVRNSGELLPGGECELKVSFSVLRTRCLQRSEVECVGEEVVNESTECETIRPAAGEVLDVNIVVLPGSALTPDQDRLHLR